MSDSRHQKRIKLMQQLFAVTFDSENQTGYLKSLPANEASYLKKILDNLEEIDSLIAKVATERPITEINKLDLAILRLIVFESMVDDTPIKVLINEAVELAKEFGSENSPKFINGVLGQILIQNEK
jgi:N utilization substance protein B